MQNDNEILNYEVPDEGNHEDRMAMISHFVMGAVAILIVVVVAAVLLARNNPVTYNEIDASNIEVSGVFQRIYEWEQDTDERAGDDTFVEENVAVSVLTKDSKIPDGLMEGVLTEMHGIQICFSQDKEKGYFAACFTSGDTTYLLESDQVDKKRFTEAVEQFVKDQY